MRHKFWVGCAAVLILGLCAAGALNALHYDLYGNNLYVRGYAYITRMYSNLIPATDDTYDIGSSSAQWKDLYVDGSAYIDAGYVDEVRLGATTTESDGVVKVLVRNKTGSSLAAGDVCVWDNTAINVVADASPAAGMTVAEDLSGEGGYYTLYVTATGTPDAGDSVIVYGTEQTNGASFRAATLLAASLNSVTMMTDGSGAIYRFSQVDSVASNQVDGPSSVQVDAMGFMTVKACDGANTDVAGVATATIADNATGWLAVFGVVEATVDAASNAASPGVLLEGASGGDAVVDAAATAAKNLGRAMEYSNADNQKIRIFVDCM